MLSAVVSNQQQASLKQPVKTILRVRPFLPHELSHKQNSSHNDNLDSSCLKLVDDHTVHITNARNPNENFAYTFDTCLSSEATQEQVFRTVSPVVDKIFEFKNATIFAYGITGAGKTFTMDGSKEKPGVIHRAAGRIFEKVERLVKLNRLQEDSTDKESFTIKMSHLEIYNEKVYDLASDKQREELQIRQDGDGNIVVADLLEKCIANFEEFEAHYKMTKENRFTAATLLNAHSSRSHSVLRFTLTRSKRNKSITTKLHLIDLAGSEDNRKTGNCKDRMVESGNINKSLFMLSQVVDALNNGASNIPYRNSKLTRLLQDSLGGKAESLMITNVAPSSAFYLDTLNTLKMAKRTRQIVNQTAVQTSASNAKSVTSMTGLRKLESSNNNTVLKKPLTSAPLQQNIIKKKPIGSTTPSANTSSDHHNIDIDTLLVNATPNTKKGILKALKKTEEQNQRLSDETQKNASRKRTLNELLSSYPLKPSKSIKLEHNTNTNNTIPEISPVKIIGNTENDSRKSNISSVPVESEDIKISDECLKELLSILNANNVKAVTKLKGIGVNRAQSIVDHYQKNGEYKSVDELSQVGIGPKILMKLQQDFAEKWRENRHS